MKIAFLLPSLRNLGPIIVVKDIVDRLSCKTGVSIDIFYFDDSNDDILKFNANCIKMDFFKKYDFEEYDVLHSHGIRPDLYTRLHNIKCFLISTQHNIIFEEFRISNSYMKSKLIEKIWFFGLRNKDIIVAIGNTAEKYYKDSLSVKNIINIPNGRDLNIKECVNDDDVLLIKEMKEKYICIGTCTRVIKRKGHEQIIKALPSLTNYCFILVGDGDYLMYLKKLAEDLGVSKRCLFLGYRSNAMAYLEYFDIFSQTSYAESISIALLEAASANKAIVCTDIPVNRDVFNDKEVAYFQPNNIKNLISAITNLSEKSDEFSKNAYEKYLFNYTQEIMADNYYNLYKSVFYEN
ncbi:glycosyltransferase family 4 protein [Acinetobacter celticus]|uniref:Glycosyl transferase family 1 domain-containing protein n=1 Tax=Acinetobacter celticus TaxID=1891224 RepID=A0A1C3D0M4_9GAMM|nr:glycosyltransferase family 4 protein [Acinetobacter celticus]ODA14596.1 hypothetical protein BBP83_02000 [Acinetobacter celticus]